MFLLVWEPAFKRMNFNFWLFISRITGHSFADVFLIIKTKRRPPFLICTPQSCATEGPQVAPTGSGFYCHNIKFPIMHLCVWWKKTKIRDCIIVVQLKCFMQWSRRWLLIYPWRYSGTTSVLKPKQPRVHDKRKNLTKIKLPQCSDRPIFQLPEQKKCVSAIATQTTQTSTDCWCSSKGPLSEENRRPVITRAGAFKNHSSHNLNQLLPFSSGSRLHSRRQEKDSLPQTGGSESTCGESEMKPPFYGSALRQDKKFKTFKV